MQEYLAGWVHAGSWFVVKQQKSVSDDVSDGKREQERDIDTGTRRITLRFVFNRNYYILFVICNSRISKL